MLSDSSGMYSMFWNNILYMLVLNSIEKNQNLEVQQKIAHKIDSINPDLEAFDSNLCAKI